MRNRTKPFVVYRRKSGSFTIVPRGPKGWAQMATWIALLVPLVLWFENRVSSTSEEDDFMLALFLFCAGTLAWVICGLWWIFARAEVVESS